MTVQIIYKKNPGKKNSPNLVLFTDEKFNISKIKKYVKNSEYSYIFDILKTKNTKKKILTFDINSKKKIILVAFKENQKNSDAENLGAKFYDLFKDLKPHDYNINTDTVNNKHKSFIGYFLHGIKLKSYKFEKYKKKYTSYFYSSIWKTSAIFER